MHNLPGTSLLVQLLDRGTIAKGLIANCVNEPITEGTAVRTADGLSELWQRILPFCCNVKGLALFKVIAFQTSTYYENFIFIALSYSKVYSIIHHFSKSFEFSRGNIEKYDLRAGYIT